MFHFSQQRQTTHLKRNLYNLLGAFDELRQMTCRGAYRRARSTLSGSSALPIMQMNRMSPRPPLQGGGRLPSDPRFQFADCGASARGKCRVT